MLSCALVQHIVRLFVTRFADIETYPALTVVSRLIVTSELLQVKVLSG